jgi:hypothetical protein
MSPVVHQLERPLAADFTLPDMKILHFWLTEGATVFTDFGTLHDNVFSDAFIHHAIEDDFLMHELLSISALHLSRLSPREAQNYLYISHTHRSKGLALFQAALSNMDESNCQSCFLFSTLTFIHAWAAQDMNKPSNLFFISTQHVPEAQVEIKWVQLHRGSRAILRSMFPQIRNGDLMPLFVQWEVLGMSKEDQLEDRDRGPFDDFRETLTLSAIPEDQKKILLESLAELRRIFCLMSFHENISKLSCMMSWFMMISDEYLVMLENKMPEALVLVAFYSVAIKRLPYMWWLDGKSENLLRTVLDELGEGWKSETRWPIEQVLGISNTNPNVFLTAELPPIIGVSQELMDTN